MKKYLISVLFCLCIPAALGGCAAETKEEQSEKPPAVYDCYEELIAAARECAVKNNGEAPKDHDFSSMLYMRKDWDYGTLGYLREDIDGNGTEELIFGGNAGESGAWYDGIVYDIYTVSDGELVHILDGWERSRYFFCTNGMIAHEGDNSAFEGTRSYFKLEGTELSLVETVTWRYDETAGENVYFYSTETEYDTEHAERISGEQAEAVTERYTYKNVVFIPFTEDDS